MTAPLLFDRGLRRLHRDRAARMPRGAFVHAYAFTEALERLAYVKRGFERALLLGCADPGWRTQLQASVENVVVADPSPSFARLAVGVVADEDRLPFADGTFDLIIAVGTLDEVDDLPGALVMIRRILRPDGLLLAAMVGAGSLPRLKSAMLAADAVGAGAAARMHPAIDIRTAGDLLARAGFAVPVADVESLDISYAGLMPLVADVRAHGAGNALVRRSRVPLRRESLAAAVAEFASHSVVDGRTIERVELLHLSGWAPAQNQARPAPPGSAARSLTGKSRTSI